MRDYAKVAPGFWIGETGKKLRKAGAEAQVLAMYLMTAPTANMLGLYYLPFPAIVHETGLTQEGALKALRSATEANFCDYDEEAEVVWVYEMASYQIAATLDPKDKRCAGVQNEYDSLPENKFLGEFFKKYREAFHMTRTRSPFKAPPKPRAGAGAGTRAGVVKGGVPPPSEFESAWAKYPKRAGDNPKIAASRCWNARLESGNTAAEMLAGVERYAAYCAKAGKVGTELVMQAKRFFGPDKPFLNEWKPENGAGSDTTQAFLSFRAAIRDQRMPDDTKVASLLGKFGGLHRLGEKTTFDLDRMRDAFDREFRSMP